MEGTSTINSRKNVEGDSENFKNPMHVAASKGDAETIEALVKVRSEICQEENGQTPLHLAVIKGKTIAVRKLISLGANISKMNKDGYASLHLAVLHDRVSLIEDLISINTENDIDISDTNGNTALHIAVSMGNANAVRALLVEGANADMINNEGNAALHLAVIQGNLKVIEVLLKYVRSPNILDKNKFNPLHLAVLCNQIDAIRKIGRVGGAEIDDLNGDGDSALHLATKLRNLEAIEALVNLNARADRRNSKGFSSLHLAVMYREMSATEILESIDGTNRFRNISIHVGEAQKVMPALKLLCRLTINFNIENSYGDSILHSVITTDCEDAVKLLLDLGAKPNVFNKTSGLTPLHVAACFGNKDIIKMLLRHGAYTNSVDRSGDFPIHSAAKVCSSVGIETLVKRVFNPFARNTSFFTSVDIIMEYVREDLFETSVQTVTDLCKEKHLKRRSPVTSHEILKSAKLIFKFDIWKKFEFSDLNDAEYISKIICPLRIYINDCFAEIRLMKSTLLHANFSLFNFTIKSGNYTMPLAFADISEVALNHILDVTTTKEYPIYRDIIVPKLQRSSLLKKAQRLKIHLVVNGKTTVLNFVGFAVPKYLNNDDILNLLLATFALDPDSSVSENAKRRKLAKS